MSAVFRAVEVPPFFFLEKTLSLSMAFSPVIFPSSIAARFSVSCAHALFFLHQRLADVLDALAALFGALSAEVTFSFLLGC